MREFLIMILVHGLKAVLLLVLTEIAGRRACAEFLERERAIAILVELADHPTGIRRLARFPRTMPWMRFVSIRHERGLRTILGSDLAIMVGIQSLENLRLPLRRPH